MDNLTQNQKTILNILNTYQPSTTLQLQCLIYILQYAEQIKTEYIFDFSLSLPFSTRLEDDYAALRGDYIQNKLVCFDLKITDAGKELVDKTPLPNIEPQKINTGFLIQTSRLVYLIDNINHKPWLDGKPVDVTDLAKRIFGAHDDKAKTQEVLGFLQKIGIKYKSIY